MKQNKNSSLDEYFKIRYVAGIFYPPVLYVFIQMFVQVIGNWYCGVQYVRQTEQVTANMSSKIVEEVQKMIEQYGYIMTACSALLGCITFLIIYHGDCKEKQKSSLTEQLKKVQTYRIGFPVLLACMANLGFSRLLSLFPTGSSARQYREVSESLMSGPLLIQFVSIAVLAPVVEELIYRGLVYNRATRYLTKVQAMIFSSLLFAFFHFNLIQGIYAFVMGMIFIFIYLKYDNLCYCIFMHSVANGTALFVRQFAVTKFINRHLVLYVTAMVLELAVACWCGYQLYKNREETLDI